MDQNMPADLLDADCLLDDGEAAELFDSEPAPLSAEEPHDVLDMEDFRPRWWQLETLE